MMRSLALLGVGCVLLSGCQAPGRGTTGSAAVETGTARADGSTPYALGRARPFQVSGLSDEAIADSRAEASLETSGAGSAELARRTAAANAQSPGTRSVWPSPPPKHDADRILLDRIELALSSTTPQQAIISHPYSIETLNNLQIGVHNGVVLLRGRANSFEERESVAAQIRAVEGVAFVKNELEVVPPPGANPGGAPSR